ncbi:AraC family transcriptional regulator [Corynebacterium suranareeae]|uniref:AraC family transcriptional regulator n=1 Tax=Corynebacterium suranareeae TaxID=2506452 RepID=A0A160PKZ5_9CORY|nr:AraC family transcriptional regulator [Corynebacterium suranareeae]BAU94289.1 AraC family transcriptional regulator [Corynebacterium suranareeae]
MFLNCHVVTITPNAVLIWVYSGRVRISIESTFELHAAQGILIPAGSEITVEYSPDALVIPIQLPTGCRPNLGVLRIPEHAHNRLMYAFAQGLGYLKESPESDAFLHELVATVPKQHSITPPKPQSAEALKASRIIIDDPITTLPIAEIARRVGLSERTLQRRFLEETGLNVGTWRTRTRLSLAVAYLSDGHTAEWAAHHVGFSGASSLAKAFRTHMGISPSQIHKLQTAHNTVPPVLGLRTGEIPENETWTRINGSHIMVWAFQGSSVVHVADRKFTVNQGEGIILPAGVRLDLHTPAGGLILPLGYQVPRAQTLGAQHVDVIQFQCSTNKLLECTISTYTPFHPHHKNPDQCFSLPFSKISTDQPPLSNDDDTLIALATDLAASRQTNVSDIRGGIAEGFAHITGIAVQRWGLVRRMTLARIQLSRGLTPGVVARNLGYAHLSAFNRAFTATHGCTPAQYQVDCVRIPTP